MARITKVSDSAIMIDDGVVYFSLEITEISDIAIHSGTVAYCPLNTIHITTKQLRRYADEIHRLADRAEAKK